MIIPLIESMVYACASAAARTPMRGCRQAPGRVVRVVSRESADRLADSLTAERRRTAALEAQVAVLQGVCAAQAEEIEAAHTYVQRYLRN